MKRLKSTTRQRGIALMMTLGVLALLLIMALAFAYTTRTERLAASVNTDLIRARLLAESGVERAIAFLREQYRANPAPGTQFFVPTTALSDPSWVFDAADSVFNRGGRYLGSVSPVKGSVGSPVESTIQAALSSTLRVGNTAYQFTPASTLHSAVGWIPIKVDHGAGVESCVGLVGYLVIDETGKLDPTQAVGVIDGTTSEATSNPDTRLGLDLREIALADVLFEAGTFSIGSMYGNSFNTEMPSPGRWHSIYHIMNEFSALGVNQSWLNRFTWSLRPFSVAEPEAYEGLPAGTLYHRCDINAINWDTTDVATFPLGQVDATQPYSAAVGIPWVGQIKASAAAVHDQVVANFIDFCDSNSVASSDYASFAAAPTYCGLERAPYVNEVQVLLSYAHDVAADPDGDGTPDGQGYFTVALSIELVNMYAEGLNTVDVEWEVVGSASAGPPEVTTPAPPWAPTPFSSVGSPLSVTVAANSYAVVDGTAYPSAVALLTKTIPLAGTTVPANVTFSISSVKVVLTGASGLADCAWVSTTGSSGTVAPGAALITPNYLYLGWAVNDPRCNTRDTEWQTIAASSDGTGMTINAANVFAVLPDTDAGTGAPLATCPDPATAAGVSKFIADRPVLSFWELGAIHRGEPWRTINLHSSDQTTATVGEYSYGDWQLLNQVKLTSDTTSRGGVNVWGVPAYVWKPLLQGVRLGASFENPAGYPAGPGVELTDNTALVAACPLIASSAPTWTAGADTYQGRGAVVGYGALSNGTLGVQDTDALQEEIIGKVVGLLNDRFSYYTIIVCAKAVQDVGQLPAGLSAPPDDWIRYDLGPGATIDAPLDGDTRNDRYCRPMAEQKVMAHVWRDVTNNQFRISDFQYLDEE